MFNLASAVQLWRKKLFWILFNLMCENTFQQSNDELKRRCYNISLYSASFVHIDLVNSVVCSGCILHIKLNVVQYMTYI